MYFFFINKRSLPNRGIRSSLIFFTSTWYQRKNSNPNLFLKKYYSKFPKITSKIQKKNFTKSIVHLLLLPSNPSTQKISSSTLDLLANSPKPSRSRPRLHPRPRHLALATPPRKRWDWNQSDLVLSPSTMTLIRSLLPLTTTPTPPTRCRLNLHHRQDLDYINDQSPSSSTRHPHNLLHRHLTSSAFLHCRRDFVGLPTWHLDLSTWHLISPASAWSVLHKASLSSSPCSFLKSEARPIHSSAYQVQFQTRPDLTCEPKWRTRFSYRARPTLLQDPDPTETVQTR